MYHFKKLHKVYPLTRYQASIVNPQTGLPLSNAKAYTCTMRQLFGALEVTKENQAWRDIERVKEYFDSLPSRQRQTILTCAWTHWRRFVGMENELPDIGFGNRIPRHVVLGPALTVLNKALKPPHSTRSLLSCHWRQYPASKVWYVVSADGVPLPWNNKPFFLPALRAVRLWGYPPPLTPMPEENMAVFLPGMPAAGSAPMKGSALYSLLDKASTAAVQGMERDCRVAHFLAKQGVVPAELEETADRVIDALGRPEATMAAKEDVEWSRKFTAWEATPG